jgi:biopolymer transport protein TolR
MAFEPGQRGQFVSQINVTPLVDVMLVLLVIFMVTAPIIQQGVEVNLPKVRAQALEGKDEQFVVSITKPGEIFLNDAKLSAAELTDKLKAIGRERPDRQVFIRADDAVPYGDVIRTMAAIKAAGIENVGMVTQVPVEGGEKTPAESGDTAPGERKSGSAGP